MIPSFFLLNITNKALRYIKSFRNYSLVCMYTQKSFYFKYIFIIKFRISSFFSTEHSSFFYHIRNIILLSSKKKMIWFYAKSVITFMENLKVVYYFSVMHFPRKSVRINSFKSKSSIAGRMPSASPIPAIVSFFDIIPKRSFRTFKIKHAGIITQDRPC